MFSLSRQGGLFSINHEDMYEEGGDEGNRCVGCAWDYRGVNMSLVNAIEVAIQGSQGVGGLFSAASIDLWDHLHEEGFTQIAPIGGRCVRHCPCLLCGEANALLPCP